MLPTSTTIQNDLRKLEMLRQKQIEEIEGMLQNQLSLEETRNKNNLKMQKQIEKEQKQHREKMILAQEEKKRIIIKEKERQEKMKEEAILLEKHYQARQEKEKQQLIEEMKIKEQERIENEKKKEMKKKRDEVFRNTIDDMYNYQKEKSSVEIARYTLKKVEQIIINKLSYEFTYNFVRKNFLICEGNKHAIFEIFSDVSKNYSEENLYENFVIFEKIVQKKSRLEFLSQ